MINNYSQLLKNQWNQDKFVCVGLDTDINKIPQHLVSSSAFETIMAFNTQIIDATYDVVCAYKPNTAFYESLGAVGVEALKKTIEYAHSVAPQVPIILDAKRADIGNTNNGYVSFAFEYLQADAITVHPYLGQEALQPFLDHKTKGIIVLCKTSNPGSDEFQNLSVGAEPLYLKVARNVSQHWNKNQNCSLVVGATYPKELEAVRQIVGDMPILIPGIGAQGGAPGVVVQKACNSDSQGFIISSSRDITFASSGADFATIARQKTLELHNTINHHRVPTKV